MKEQIRVRRPFGSDTKPVFQPFSTALTLGCGQVKNRKIKDPANLVGDFIYLLKRVKRK